MRSNDQENRNCLLSLANLSHHSILDHSQQLLPFWFYCQRQSRKYFCDRTSRQGNLGTGYLLKWFHLCLFAKLYLGDWGFALFYFSRISSRRKVYRQV